MDRDFRKIIVLSLLILMFGGVSLLIKFWAIILQVIISFFPFFCEVGKMALEEYLTSPYFIVSIIMAIGSAMGIWFGVKGGKILYLIVSIICDITIYPKTCWLEAIILLPVILWVMNPG